VSLFPDLVSLGKAATQLRRG